MLSIISKERMTIPFLPLRRIESGLAAKQRKILPLPRLPVGKTTEKINEKNHLLHISLCLLLLRGAAGNDERGVHEGRAEGSSVQSKRTEGGKRA